VHYGPWYGDRPAVERWWPLALAEWRAALRGRVTPLPQTESLQQTERLPRTAPSWPVA
jgi:hypothetical protein